MGVVSWVAQLAKGNNCRPGQNLTLELVTALYWSCKISFMISTGFAALGFNLDLSLEVAAVQQDLHPL